jgi:CPA2 family monovalent cation:H+ antiporter-2
MIGQPFLQLLLLLGVGVFVVGLFLRLRIPSSLAYLLAGILLGPHTAGPVVEAQYVRGLAEFGIVFLLFTIGLNFSLPQIYTLRHQVLALGTGQVLLTTTIIGILAWWAGLPPAAAFVVGAVFAQSSSTIIAKQLAEQHEDKTRHGRLALAMSVFQDVTAAPFVVIIPVLGAATAQSMAGLMAGAVAKAVLVFALVYGIGRRVLRPFFHAIASMRSPELFTLTVLFVSLLAAWTTNRFELSMPFGAFLAGMVLGDTEFRHQIESAIRPFRDVLLGLFFVSVGMLFDPALLPGIWHLSLGAAAVLLVVKTGLVAQLVRFARVEAGVAWRTGTVLAVGGEFGFALLAISLDSGVIAQDVAQVALTAVLISMVAGPFLIRKNQAIAARVSRSRPEQAEPLHADSAPADAMRDHVIICGYGRIGQTVGHFLEEEAVPYVALDLDPIRVRAARAAGEPVHYGDSTEPDVLESMGLGAARLVLISHDDVASALKTLHHIRRIYPQLPVMVRTRDESPLDELRKAGATEVVPETVEAGMMIVAHVLLLLKAPISRVFRRLQEERSQRYRLIREFFRGGESLFESGESPAADLHTVSLAVDSGSVGRTLADLRLEGVLVTAIVREGKRILAPKGQTRLEAGDVVVLSGPADDVSRAESRLLG